MAILIVNSLNGKPIEEFGIRTAEKWKIGRKGKDNGAILIIALNDRKIRLEIGYGWEGRINDARAGDIIRAISPYFKKGKFKEGILKAIAYTEAFVLNKITPQQKKELKKSKKKSNALFFPLFMFIVFIVLFFKIRRRNYRTYRRGGSGFWGGFGGGFGSGSGGSFSGGGGSFGGGGASGGW